MHLYEVHFYFMSKKCTLTICSAYALNTIS